MIPKGGELHVDILDPPLDTLDLPLETVDPSLEARDALLEAMDPTIDPGIRRHRAPVGCTGNQPMRRSGRVGRTLPAVPTILRSGPYRVHFFSADYPEPPHVHVTRDEKRAKIWLKPVAVAWARHFTRREIGDILHLVREHQLELVRKWDEYFKD